MNNTKAPFLFLLFIVFTLPAVSFSVVEERPEVFIQAFYKAANEGKYEEAKQYLSKESTEILLGPLATPAERSGIWQKIFDSHTKSRTLKTVEVGKMSLGEAVTGTVLLRFADGGTHRLQIELVKEAGQWKFSWIGTVEEEQAFQDYVIRISANAGDRDDLILVWGGSSLDILKSLQRVYTERSYKFRIEHVGKDVTGNGVPNLVVAEHTGGAHCCNVIHLFEIGGQFRQIAELDGAHSPVELKDLDGDSKLEVVMRDWRFAYWRASFPGSPKPPTVILRYRDGAYRVAADLMRKPAPSPTELKRRAQRVRADESWKETGEPPSDLWSYMLELLYTGHGKLAWQFWEMAWRPGVSGKEESLREFRAHLSASPFWPLDSKRALSFVSQ